MQIILFSCIWILVFLFFFWRLAVIARQAVNHLHRLHRIPCSGCAFFTGDYRLKCTVNPIMAMSEEAIGCRDFMARTNFTFNNCRGCNYKSQLNKN